MNTTAKTPAYCPGPWSADLDPTDDGNVYVYPTRDGEHSSERADICTVLGWGGDDERNANAALIAAAPELLEAARYALDCATCKREGRTLEEMAGKVRQLLTDAIAKAEGRS